MFIIQACLLYVLCTKLFKNLHEIISLSYFKLTSQKPWMVTSRLVVLQEKASRIDRIVTEHQLFSQGLKELQNWVVDTSHMLQTYCAPTADKNVLDSRMIKLEV